MGPPKIPAQFHFSTDAFPERERLTAWREVFGRAVCNLDINPLARDGFRCEANVCQVPGLGVMFATSSAVQLCHSQELIKDDDLSFMAAPTCRWTATQLGRSSECGPGDGVLMDNSEVGSLTLSAASRFVTFRVPRAAIEPLVPDLGATVARAIPAANVALRLLVSYLASAFDTDALITPELRQFTVAHVYDLLAVALGATREATETAKGRGIRAARLRAIKADILRHLKQQKLSIGAVAIRHGITPVYVRKMFESEGTSFSEFVLEQRLDLARQMLTDPCFADRTIAIVAWEAGFGDLSYFNQTFRRRFGRTPSDMRAEARPL